MDISWLTSVTDAWRSSAGQGREPHALMLAGPAGTGKRAAAAWLARQRLAIEPLDSPPQYPLEIPEHADLRWVTQPEDKHTIGIDQVRELVAELSLTSYEGRGKAAVIAPADAMTHSAANGLLKTLEEPPGATLLVLVVDRPGRLPATIVSRCQRLNVRAPAAETGLAWLQAVKPGNDWLAALSAAGNAPLAALEVQAQMDENEAMLVELAAVGEGREAPLAVAARWAKMEPDRVLMWLSRQVQRCIMRTSGTSHGAGSGTIRDSVLERIDRRNLFCYLDIINGLRGQPAGSFDVQLTLECLLIDWAEGLKSLTTNEQTL